VYGDALHWDKERGCHVFGWQDKERGVQDVNERMEVMEGDITTLDVDAIVNAANKTLLGGGGVDGAIHRAAGQELLEECRGLRGCETGQAKMTQGYRLPAKHVIHTVGPVWYGGKRNEPERLEDCYRNSLQLAAENGLKTVAFPAISTGVYRFPADRACRIAVDTVSTFISEHPEIEKVVFCCFDANTAELYRKALGV